MSCGPQEKPQASPRSEGTRAELGIAREPHKMGTSEER